MNAAWDRAFPNCIHDAAGRRMTTTMRFGLRAMVTPLWAQHIGTSPDPKKLIEALTAPRFGLVVLDLAHGEAAPMPLPKGIWTVQKHTRTLPLSPLEDPVDPWPSHRKKQLKRALRDGAVASPTQDLDLLVQLHQAARDRKGLKSDETTLRQLLSALLEEPDTHAWKVTLSNGKVAAGGVFHGQGSDVCVYGFGGQFRGGAPGESSRATVLLIATAMRHAAAHKATHFDFGGSADPGVDRFYAEFGAEKKDKIKLVRIRWPWRWLMRQRRPDLFP